MASRKDRTLTELTEYARLVVRAGYLAPAEARREVGDFIRAEVADEAEAAALTERLVTEAETELAAEAATWPPRTDNDALAEALAELRRDRFLVLEHCADHYDASAALRAEPGAAGVVFFTETDVWHAITDRMLEIKVWHADTANVVPGDPELDRVLTALRSVGLPAVFDEGRIEVTLTWRRRPAR